MVNHWLCVTSNKNWEIVVEEKVWGVSERKRHKIEKVREGDFLVFYVRSQGLAGILKVASEPFEDHKRLFEAEKKAEIYPRRVKLKTVVLSERMIPYRELANKLKFLSEGPWALQATMREITEKEYKTLKALLS